MLKRLRQINLFKLPAFLLFFLMIFVPTTYQPIKAVLILIVVSSIAMEAFLTKRIALHPVVAAITVAMSVVGVFFVNVGLLHANPGALRVLPLYVFWPILYLIFIAGCARENILSGLMKVMVTGSIAVCIYAMLYILHAGGQAPSFLYFELDQGQKIGFYEGHIQYALYSISSLLFLVPFLLSALILWPEESRPPVSRRWLWIAFILSIVPVILTERKVLWMLVLASPLMGLALRSLLPPESRDATREIAKRAAIGIISSAAVLLLVLRFAVNFDFSTLTNMLGEAFNVSSGVSEDVVIRKAQYSSMMGEWANSPLLGTGLGGVASYVRNREQPWTYELSYVALLYHTGFIGLLIYSAGVGWTYVHSLLVLRTDRQLGVYMAPVLVGTTCFLIGNATNPYLETYDYLWVLFLPIAIVNLWLLRRTAVRKEAAQDAS